MRKKGKVGGEVGESRREERRETEGSEANVQLITCILYKIAQAKQRQRVQVRVNSGPLHSSGTHVREEWPIQEGRGSTRVVVRDTRHRTLHSSP